MNLAQDDKNRIISGAITALFLALIIIVCLAFGYVPPDPPIPEEGVEVNLGNSDFGQGDAPVPEASEASSAPRPAAAAELVSTQRTVSTTPINTSPKPSTAKRDNPTPTTTKPEPPKEPEINTKALFNGNKSKKNANEQSGSQGNTYSGGNQGREGGDANSNRYDGAPGKGGAQFSLNGRGAKALPTPNSTTQKQGKIVVQIFVDRSGNVVKVDAPAKGSTLSDAALVAQSKAAAMKAKFSPSDDAPEIQTGTITYVYRNN